MTSPKTNRRQLPQTASTNQRRLGQLLLDKRLISRRDLNHALEVQLRTRDRLGRILMSLDLIKRRHLYPVLAEMWGFPFVDLVATKPDVKVTRQFESRVLMEKRMVPVRLYRPKRRRRHYCLVATSDEPTQSQSDLIHEVLGDDVDVEFCVTTDWDIDRALAEVFEDELIVEATSGLFNRSPHESAFRTFHQWQAFAIGIVLAFFVIGLVLLTSPTLLVVSAVINGCFLLSITFKVVASLAGMRLSVFKGVTDKEVAALNDSDLPVYTILVPVYREAKIVSKLLENLGRIDYPTSKLEILLLLEEDDDETLEAARAAQPPETVTFVVVPDSQPRTKPRACNVGLFFAKGQYLVIYDAEDRPDPDQLKKAYLAFQRGDDDLVCVQAALNYFNRSQNLLTRMFTLEYSYWFDYMLHGLARLGLPIPLGGTSNHFRTDYLRELGGWDPYNVTEDADLGIRAAARGYKVGVINSTTFEEANSRAGNWIRQRSRWIKGYMQTTLVYTRNPVRFVCSVGLKQTLGFALLIAGTPLTFLFTLPMWLLFSGWLAFGLPLDDLYPVPVLWVGMANLILGNVLMVAVNALGVLRRKNYDLLIYALVNPLYWFLHSLAAYKALWQLLTRPFYWEKTEHGLVEEAADVPEEVSEGVPTLRPTPRDDEHRLVVTPGWAVAGAKRSIRTDIASAFAGLCQRLGLRASSSHTLATARPASDLEPSDVEQAVVTPSKHDQPVRDKDRAA